MLEQQSVAAPTLATRAKWSVFRVLEWAANLRARLRSGRNRADETQAPGAAASSERRFWVFVSTIGELNAIEPFLKAFLAAAGDPPLLLISDHEHYRDPYLAKYPAAEFACLRGVIADAARLIRAFPPRALLIAEIPCVLSDAPCRLSFSIVYELKRRGVPVCLVNGWLYHYAPESRLDAIERRWFNREYLRLIDTLIVQTEEVKRYLVDHGGDPAHIDVAGNIKFDAMATGGWSPERARSPELLREVQAGGRPCIVAGCVTEFEDQEFILSAFGKVLAAVPEAFLVLAPRHPEFKDRMEKLEALLRSRDYRHAFRSRLNGARLPTDAQVLVLDTIGELKDFYAIATLAFVGVDHNVLEPLAFDKPVFVKPGWEATYPSYPVYRLLRQHDVLIEVADDAELAREWTALLLDPERRRTQAQRIDAVLARERGASRRCLELLAARGWLPAMR